MLARERKAKFVLMWMMARYYFDYPWRSKTRRDRRLTGGQALLGGLFTALRQRGVTLWLNTPMVSLTQASARQRWWCLHDGQDVTVRARRAVVLGAGGFERNQAMREQYLPQPTDQAWTATPARRANTGDAIRAGAA